MLEWPRKVLSVQPTGFQDIDVDSQKQKHCSVLFGSVYPAVTINMKSSVVELFPADHLCAILEQ